MFLGNNEIANGEAHTIAETLIAFIKDCGISMSNCVSLATDGASVMMGKKTGVGVQHKAKSSPFMFQTHCVAHRLNLAVLDSIRTNAVLLQNQSIKNYSYPMEIFANLILIQLNYLENKKDENISLLVKNTAILENIEIIHGK